jgi:hypothetical protein
VRRGAGAGGGVEGWGWGGGILRQGAARPLILCSAAAPLPPHSRRPINLIDEGYVKRVRGIAVTTKVSPQVGNRIVDGAR